MADTEKSDVVNSGEGDSAEKAYAAAAEAVEAKAIVDTPVEFPSKAKREPKPRPAAAPAPAVEALPVAEAPVAKPIAVAPEPMKPAMAKPVIAKPAIARKQPVAKAKPLPKPLEKAPASKAAKPIPAPRKPAPALFTRPQIATKKPAISQLKEKTMATKINDFTSDKFNGVKDAFTDVKTKAKAAFDKGAASIGDAADFAKGNVEAIVESGKIYVAGIQELGSTYVAGGKSGIEKLTADAKELAAQKSPTDFFKLQGEIARKNFESAMAFGSQSNEAWVKLAKEAFVPISGRVSLVVDKVKTAA